MKQQILFISTLSLLSLSTVTLPMDNSSKNNSITPTFHPATYTLETLGGLFFAVLGAGTAYDFYKNSSSTSLSKKLGVPVEQVHLYPKKPVKIGGGVAGLVGLMLIHTCQ